MERKSYHVIARSNGRWSVKRTGAERASGIYATKKDAVTNARRLVMKSGGGELIIHEKDGRIKARDSFDNDPNPPRDNKRNCVADNSRSIKG